MKLYSWKLSKYVLAPLASLIFSSCPQTYLPVLTWSKCLMLTVCLRHTIMSSNTPFDTITNRYDLGIHFWKIRGNWDFVNLDSFWTEFELCEHILVNKAKISETPCETENLQNIYVVQRLKHRFCPLGLCSVYPHLGNQAYEPGRLSFIIRNFRFFRSDNIKGGALQVSSVPSDRVLHHLQCFTTLKPCTSLCGKHSSFLQEASGA